MITEADASGETGRSGERVGETYVLLTHCEVVLHGFLCILVEWLALCFVG